MMFSKEGSWMTGGDCGDTRFRLTVPLLTCVLKLRVANGNNVSATGSLFAQKERRNSVLALVSNLQKQSKCSYSCLVAAFLYIDRLQKSGWKGFELSLQTFRRLFTTALTIATKYLDDDPANNRTFARAADLQLDVLNNLEVLMLHALNFRLYIRCEEFFQYESRLFSEAMQSNDLSALHLKVMLAEHGVINRRDIAVAACNAADI